MKGALSPTQAQAWSGVSEEAASQGKDNKKTLTVPLHRLGPGILSLISYK
ncbi:hypothetical protein [Parendozoicomonas sp. Alg238-R29]|nr:hypothetical protein [Parendozoicomonas sp. Alg238-R29]